MVYTLACFLSNKVAAFAPVSGSMSPDDYQICNPQRPIPVIHIHGTSDDSIPIQGNDYVTPLQQVSSYLSSLNNCSQKIQMKMDMLGIRKFHQIVIKASL